MQKFLENKEVLCLALAGGGLPLPEDYVCHKANDELFRAHSFPILPDGRKHGVELVVGMFFHLKKTWKIGVLHGDWQCCRSGSRLFGTFCNGKPNGEFHLEGEEKCLSLEFVDGQIKGYIKGEENHPFRSPLKPKPTHFMVESDDGKTRILYVEVALMHLLEEVPVEKEM
ncbi:hypothetical protein [Brazilian marseillevirus]|uniref:hypothetical protein n=1 Tax=Brazilian marseillevirus TaxID=1813599 RepID=UPI0007866229|nr:hypothetical protein A3303_gp178 [Brazilian marseillevirus]AMQ10686.1 hypothetical protein [Brazilian marseillevirus]